MATPKPAGADPDSTRPSIQSRVLSSLLFAMPYAAILLWFHDADIYHRHFSDTGWFVGVYNVCRILFIFYLFWIVEAAGALLLRVAAGAEFGKTALFERIILCFFTGTGVWLVGMAGLGYLSLYSVPVAITLTVPFVILSWSDARDAALSLYGAAVDCRTRITHRDTGVARPLWGVLLAAAFVALLLVKGLYPGGNIDYFTSYFRYYQSVIAHHGIWPNEVWYHYFYDKGAGLTFLAMLLTDPLGPQLATFCSMAVAALVVFFASSEASPGTDWPWLATLLFVVIYIYTPNWAEFEKTHEQIATLVIAAVWMGGRAFARCGVRPNRLWPVAAISAFIAAVIIAPPISIVFGAIFGILFVWYFATGDRLRARLAFLFASIVGTLLLGTFAVNYVTAGIFSDLVVLPAWRLSNVEKLYSLHTLSSVLVWTWEVSSSHVDFVPLSRVLKVLDQTSRFDLVYPFVDGAFAIAIIALIVRRRNGRWSAPLHAPYQAGILLAAVLTFVAVALFAGRAHVDSFYRFASFAVPLILVGSVTLWGLPISGADPQVVRVAQDRRLPFFVFSLCLVTIAFASHPVRLFSTVLPRAARFAVGNMSIDTAYTLQPVRYPLGENGIFSGARGAYAVVGRGIPIWSLHHVMTYCMLPDCRMETYREYALPGWPTIMFGSPEQAQHDLQASDHNYFLFVRNVPIVDCLPLSPLFSPDTIARFLGIRWTDGETALLTWLGPGIQPLDAAWLDDYRKAVEQSGTVRNFPYEAMKQIFARLEATPHPWRSFALPWTGGDVAQ